MKCLLDRAFHCFRWLVSMVQECLNGFLITTHWWVWETVQCMYACCWSYGSKQKKEKQSYSFQELFLYIQSSRCMILFTVWWMLLQIWSFDLWFFFLLRATTLMMVVDELKPLIPDSVICFSVLFCFFSLLPSMVGKGLQESKRVHESWSSLWGSMREEKQSERLLLELFSTRIHTEHAPRGQSFCKFET